jgi:hypothetical protein
MEWMRGQALNCKVAHYVLGDKVIIQRPVAQTAFAGYLVKNPFGWRPVPLDIIGGFGNDISQSWRN